MNVSDTPRVSVVVPVYNVERYIGKCARSVFAQSYGNIEAVFVDDASPDGSMAKLAEVATEFPDARYRVITHKANKGLSGARNSGVAATTGAYILHLDADDWLPTNAVNLLVNKAESAGADIVIGGYTAVFTHKHKDFKPNHLPKDDLVQAILYNQIPGSMWAKLIRSSLYRDYPDVGSVEGINHAEDYATMPRLLYRAAKIAYLDEVIYYYNLTNQGSYVHNISRASMESHLRADQVLLDFFRGKLPQTTLDTMLIRTKTALLKSGNTELYREAARLYPNIPIDYSQLSLADKILLRCAGHGFDRLLAAAINLLLHNK